MVQARVWDCLHGVRLLLPGDLLPRERRVRDQGKVSHRIVAAKRAVVLLLLLLHIAKSRLGLHTHVLHDFVSPWGVTEYSGTYLEAKKVRPGVPYRRFTDVESSVQRVVHLARCSPRELVSC